MIHTHHAAFDILLVEDDPGDANLVRLAFREWRVGCRLHHTVNGVEALAFLRRQSPHYLKMPRPNLILLDLNMPRKNGRETLKEIKGDPELQLIPVVILTTSTSDIDVDDAYNLGANSFIVKPIDLDDFMKTIHSIEQYWLHTVRLPH